MKILRLHRSQRTLEHHGDLLVAQSLAEPQHQRLPLAIGQLGHFGPQALLPLGDLEGRFSRWGRPVLCRFVSPQHLQLPPPRAGLSPLAPLQIQQNPVKPGVDRAAARESVGPPREHEECLLRQIVGVPGIARQHERRPMDPGEMLLAGLGDFVRRHAALNRIWRLGFE